MQTIYTEWLDSEDTGVYLYPPECVISGRKAAGTPLVVSNGETIIVVDVTHRKDQLVRLLRRAADKLEATL